MNNLIGISGAIKTGKDLVGEMLLYMGAFRNPTYKGFMEKNPFQITYKIKKCADKLKDCVCVILGCTRYDLEDRDYKEKELGEEWWYYKRLNKLEPYLDNTHFEYKTIELIKLTPRLILQLLGTQAGRMIIHPNIWVNALFSDYEAEGEMSSDPFDVEVYKTGPYPNWIITDIRFPNNEGKAVTNRGGLLIGIKRLFRLRFPEYEDLIDATMDGYAIPEELRQFNPDLYKSLMHESETSMGDHSWCDSIIENNGTMEELFDNVLEAVQDKKNWYNGRKFRQIKKANFYNLN